MANTTSTLPTDTNPFAGFGRLIEQCIGKICKYERESAAEQNVTAALEFDTEHSPEALRRKLDEAKLKYEEARSLFMSVNINPHPDKKWVREVRKRAVKAWHEYDAALTDFVYLGDGSVEPDARP